ncbi:MAG: DUF411 domain-containing protein [Bdellovibrionota bacterium]|nr:DUF411 domain-containing protein [Bdellovibrionota bacterium]
MKILKPLGYSVIFVTLLYIFQNNSFALPKVKVFRSPTCGCCMKWVDHLKKNGFEVDVIDKSNLSSIKKGRGVPAHLQSCHTAIVGGYTIEGHVPASEIKKLLKQKMKVKGLAVGGMPYGSPGMEYQNRIDPYDVISFGHGKNKVFASYPKK